MSILSKTGSRVKHIFSKIDSEQGGKLSENLITLKFIINLVISG